MAKHWRTKIRTHITDDGNPGGGEKEEPEETQMKIHDEEDPGETVEHCEKAEVIFSRTGAVVHVNHEGTRCTEGWATLWLVGMEVHLW